MQAVLDLSQELADDDKELTEDSLQQLSEEIASPTPRKGKGNGALSVLSGINGSAQFAAAVAQIAEFDQSFMA